MYLQSTQPSLHHSAPERGMVGDNLHQANRYRPDLQWGKGCLWTQLCLDDLEAHTLPNTRVSLLTCQDRYGARLKNLASGQKAEKTKKFFLHLSQLFTIKEISQEQVLRTSSPKYRQREQVREPTTYLFRDSHYHNAFYYHST